MQVSIFIDEVKSNDSSGMSVDDQNPSYDLLILNQSKWFRRDQSRRFIWRKWDKWFKRTHYAQKLAYSWLKIFLLYLYQYFNLLQKCIWFYSKKYKTFYRQYFICMSGSL